MLKTQQPYNSRIPQDYVDALTTVTRNMYTFVAGHNHQASSATVMSKKVRSVESLIFRAPQDFLHRKGGFKNVHEMLLRLETPHRLSLAHAKLPCDEKPAGPSSQHQETQQRNRQNSTNQSNQSRKGSKPSIPKETPNTENLQTVNNI